MNKHIGGDRQADVHRLGVELLRQGERFALAGLLQQAESIFCQVWALAVEHAPGLCDTAAWDIAWLRLRMQDYAEAERWLSRITAPPTIASQLWADQCDTLIQLCRALRGGEGAPHGVALAPLTALPAPPVEDRPGAQLIVTNFGRFQIARAERPLPACRSRKAIAVFRYLLARRQRSAQREELMEVLWPDSEPREAAHSVHVAISALRRYLDPSANRYVVFASGQYAIAPDAALQEDTHLFAQASDRADRLWKSADLAQAELAYAEAVGAYTGDYYVDEQDLPWAIAESERLLARYLLALDRLGHILAAQRRFAPAAEYYQRLIERDCYREDIHCELMRCYLELGRRGDALRQYQRCATLLMNDLGLEPMEETRQLYSVIIGAAAAPSNGRSEHDLVF